MHFGGIRAVDGVTVSIAKGSITGLIGPNGAGKSTLFNVIAGLFPPTSGRVWLDGEEITGLPPHALFHKRLLRTFQIAHEFTTLTVRENLMMVPAQQPGEVLWDTWFKAGKVRYVGSSNQDAALLGEALKLSADKGLPRYQTIQNEFNLYERSKFEGALQELCVKEQVSGIHYYGLASGFLTGKYRSAADAAKSSRGGGVVSHYLNERGLKILAAMDEVRSDRDQPHILVLRRDPTGLGHQQLAVAVAVDRIADDHARVENIGQRLDRDGPEGSQTQPRPR